jgi:hypothetical protein
MNVTSTDRSLAETNHTAKLELVDDSFGIPFCHTTAGARLRALEIHATPPGERPTDPAEGALFDLLASNGFRAQKRGWPDFLVLDSSGAIVGCVEVKAHRSVPLQPFQKIVLAELDALGITCYRWSPDIGFRRASRFPIERTSPSPDLPAGAVSLPNEALGLFIKVRELCRTIGTLPAGHGLMARLERECDISPHRLRDLWPIVAPFFNERAGSLYYGFERRPQ